LPELEAYVVEPDRRKPTPVVITDAAFAAPKGASSEWTVSPTDDGASVGESLAKFILRWVVPLLDGLRTHADLIDHYRRRDERLIWPDSTVAAVIVAMLLEGRLDDAKQVKAEQFPRETLPELFPKVAALFASSSAAGTPA
jgi:hypothetical protein